MDLKVLQDGSENIRYQDPAVPIYVCRGDLAGMTNMSALCHWHEDVERLKSTDMTVTEIAGCCGFSGASYFTEQFTKHKGMSPTAFRKG